MSVKPADLPNKFFYCTRDEKNIKGDGTQEIYGLFHRICRSIPSDLRESTVFEADKIIVVTQDPALAKSITKNIDQIGCYLGYGSFSAIKPIVHIDKERVLINFHLCDPESQR